MDINLEIEKYNYYRLIGENYVPKNIDLAFSKSKNYLIVENILFHVKTNKNLGLYYTPNFLNEQEEDDGYFWDNWSAEDWIDLGVAGISTALDVTGVASGAAKAIDVVHGLSFIYRGITRNDIVYTVIGMLSISLATIPVVGSAIKGVIIGISKAAIGKPISFLIKMLKADKLWMKTVVPMSNAIIKGLSQLKNKLVKWAKEYEFFNKVWVKVSGAWDKTISTFKQFMNNFKPKPDSKVGKTIGQLSKQQKITQKFANDTYETIVGSALAKRVEYLASLRTNNPKLYQILSVVPFGPTPFVAALRNVKLYWFKMGDTIAIKKLKDLEKAVSKVIAGKSPVKPDTKILNRTVNTIDDYKEAKTEILQQIAKVQEKQSGKWKAIKNTIIYWIGIMLANEIIYSTLCAEGIIGAKEVKDPKLTNESDNDSPYYEDKYAAANMPKYVWNGAKRYLWPPTNQLKQLMFMLDCEDVVGKEGIYDGVKGLIEKAIGTELFNNPEIQDELEKLETKVDAFGNSTNGLDITNTTETPTPK
tara:strand:- start:4878 stop:6470 length:1593 start_codon:yes stop_codon:yes gene_type:complete